MEVAIPKLAEYYCIECGSPMSVDGWTQYSHKEKSDIILYHPDHGYKVSCENNGKKLSVKYDDFWDIKDFPEVETTIPTTHKTAD